MAKLTTLSARLKSLSPNRIVGEDRNRRELLRSRTQPWRGWYKTARWESLRQAAFLRDRWTCQRSGELCIGKGQEPNAPVANHTIPHRGDPALFWSLDNIETVSKRVHDSLIKAEENARAAEYWRTSNAQSSRTP